MEKNEQTSLSGALTAWLQKNRLVLIISAAVLVAVLIIVGAVSAVNSSRAEKSLEALISFEESYSAWQAAGEEDAAAAEALETAFAEIEAEYAGTYGYQRALFLMGDYFYSSQDWAEAIDSYTNLAEEFPKSYLAPLALYNAAAANEEQGDTADASELYRRIAEAYAESPLAPRALFSLGRTLEGSDRTEAVTVYTNLGERFPQSSWTKLARSRIIELNLAD
jgi:TolA-binding protein